MPRSQVRWILVFWMFVVSAIAFLDRVNISTAGPMIEKQFNLDHVQFGSIMSAFLLGYALFQAPGGWLADRFGPRKILTIATVWWAVFTTLTALVPSGFVGALVALMSVRFFLGIGEAVMYPASNRLVASWIPSQERGIANGIIFAGVGVGAGITPPLIAYIMIHHGWRWSFFISALVGLVAGAIWLLIGRDNPKQHPWISNEEIAKIESGLPKSAAAKPLPWRSIVSNRNVWVITLSYFTYGYVAYIFFTWFLMYLNTVRGLNLKSSSYYSVLPPLAMAIGAFVGGFISDRIAKYAGKRAGRCGVACVGMALAAIFVALGPRAQDVRIASIILAGGAGALYLSQSSFWSVSSDIAGRSAGSVSGFMNMGNQIGGAVTASLTPIIAKHFGWGKPFLVAAALCLLGSIAWLFIRPEQEIASDILKTEAATASQR